MLLFRCCTLVHLFNAIHIKNCLFPNEKADIILNKIADFSSIVPLLEKQNLFQNIFQTDDSLKNQIKSKSDAKKYFKKYNFSNQYNELFIGVPYSTDIYLFDFLKQTNPNLKLSCYEEGQITYLLNWYLKIKLSCGSNEKLLKKCLQHTHKCYLYVPSLYCGNGFESKLEIIPQVSSKEYVFQEIFPKVDIPKEKYIFLEENFFGDYNCATDIDCLDYVSEIVGKENVIVKLHPRGNCDRFSPRGYKVFPYNNLPWEYILLMCNSAHKIILTISSGGSITGNTMFANITSSINLFKYINIGSNFHVRERNFRIYFQKLMEYANKDIPTVFCPSNNQELQEIIKFVSRKEYINSYE